MKQGLAIVLLFVSAMTGHAMDVAFRYLEQGRNLAESGGMDSLQLLRMESMYQWEKLSQLDEEASDSELSPERIRQWEQTRRCFFNVYKLTESYYRQGKATARQAYEAAQNLYWIEMCVDMLNPHEVGAEKRAQQRILKAARKYVQRLQRGSADSGEKHRLAMLHAERCLNELLLSVGDESLTVQELALVDSIRRNFVDSLALANRLHKSGLMHLRTIAEIELERLRFELYILVRCGDTRAARRSAKHLAKESASYYHLLKQSGASAEALLTARLRKLAAERTARQLE